MIRRSCNVLALVLMGFGFGCIMATPEPASLRAAHDAAMHCARTLEDFTDQNIVNCFTDRGLPVPDDL